MSIYVGYMRISTKQDREKQKFDRQEKALLRFAKENNVRFLTILKDDASGKDFNRSDWKYFEDNIANEHNDVVLVIKDISRFSRANVDESLAKYMELMEKGVTIIFLDNPTISTNYIQQMMTIAENQENRIAKETLNNTIRLMLMIEMDRAEQERLTLIKRIEDGIKASGKKSGRAVGKCDKVTEELIKDIDYYLGDRSVKISDLLNKHKISRNTFYKYVNKYKEGTLVV